MRGLKSRSTTAVLILAMLIVGIVPAAEKAPEPAHPAPPPPKWSGNINFAWAQSAGNTDSMAASMSASVTRKAPKNLFEASGHAYYGETDGDQTTDKGDAMVRFSYFHTARFFSYYEAGVYYDDFRRLDVGTRLAAGVGRKFVDTETTKLNGRLGAAR
ncbi:DUF481 domain-containing protein, partial [Planctomycetota bacterium]